jgi:hypothetical protein
MTLGPPRLLEEVPKLEREIQAQCVRWAKSHGWKARKFSSPATSGVPDYIFRAAPAIIVFVEFKAVGKKPSELQAIEIADMIADGFDVYACDNLEDFKKILNRHADPTFL